MDKMVANKIVEGARVVGVGWSTVQVVTEDGTTLEIRAEHGHSGIELNVYKTVTK